MITKAVRGWIGDRAIRALETSRLYVSRMAGFRALERWRLYVSKEGLEGKRLEH